MKSISMNPALSRIYDNSNKLDSQLTIISNLLSTGDVEKQEIIHAANIAWDINHQIGTDIPEVIDSGRTEKSLSNKATLTKKRVSALFDDVEAIHMTTRMLLNRFKTDPSADEEGIYEGVIQGLCNMSGVLMGELFEIKEGKEYE